MAVSIFFIAVLSYALGLLDTCGLILRYVFREEVRELRRADYAVLYRRHKWPGVGYALAADVLRAIITVLIGGMLLKGAGFPSIGKLLAMFFALLGQAVPLTDRMISKQELVFPAALLLFVDWRLFLICVVLGVVILALTGNRALMAAAAAVAMPVFTAVFGGWWLKIVLAAACALAILHCYWRELPLKGLAEKVRKPRAPREAEAPKPEEEKDKEG